MPMATNFYEIDLARATENWAAENPKILRIPLKRIEPIEIKSST